MDQIASISRIGWLSWCRFHVDINSRGKAGEKRKSLMAIFEHGLLWHGSVQLQIALVTAIEVSVVV